MRNPWATRVRVMKCDFAVQLCAYCIRGCTVHTLQSVGWRFFSSQPKPVLPMIKQSPLVRAWRMLRIPIVRLPLGLVPRCRWWRNCLQVGPRSWRSCLSPTCFRVNDVVVFFVATKLLPSSLSYLSTAKNCSVFLLGSCQVLVVHSFAFSFRLSKVGSLIEWILCPSFRICCKNAIIRNLNSFSSRSRVDLRLQGKNCRTLFTTCQYSQGDLLQVPFKKYLHGGRLKFSDWLCLWHFFFSTHFYLVFWRLWLRGRFGFRCRFRTIVTLMPETALVSLRTLAFVFPLVTSTFSSLNATCSLSILDHCSCSDFPVPDVKVS